MSCSTVQIRAYNFKQVGDGNLKAFCSVDIAGKITIHGCRIVQQKGQIAWASLPQSAWTDRDGQRRYFAVIELPKSVEHEVKRAVLRGWEEFEYASV